MSEAKKETVNHPDHYNKHPSGVECITVVEHFGFNIGNAIKYLWRAGFKSPDPKEDLKKSAWYVQRELERLGEKLVPRDLVVDELKKVRDELKRVWAENAALEANHTDKADLLRRRVSDLESAIDAQDQWLVGVCDLAGAPSYAALQGKIEKLKAQAAKAEALEELLDQMRKGEKEREEQTSKPALPHPEFGRWVQVQAEKDGPVRTLKVCGYLVHVDKERDIFFNGTQCVPCGPPNDAAQPATPPYRVIQKIGGYVRRTVAISDTPVGEVAEVIGWSEIYLQYVVRRPNGERCEWLAENCAPCDPPETKPPVG